MVVDGWYKGRLLGRAVAISNIGMSRRELRQHNLNLPYRFPASGGCGEAAGGRLPPVPSKLRKNEKLLDHEKSLAFPGGPLCIYVPPPKIHWPPPTFASVIPRCRIHSAYNIVPARTQYQQAVEPLDILNHFLITPLIELIDTNTSTYATQRTAERELGGGWG